MKTSLKITLGIGALSLALVLASLVIWLMALAFNGIYNLATEGGCAKYNLSNTQTLDTCGLYEEGR